MLQPRKVKFRKVQKGKIGRGVKEDFLYFGSYGLRALEYGRITAKQLESALKTINKSIKKLGQVRLRIFPHIPVTEKPTEVRMGKGKGIPSFWVAKVKPGQMLFEVGGTNLTKIQAINSLKMGKIKLPINTGLTMIQ